MVRKRKQLYVSYKFYTFSLHLSQTRMHSSRTRTVRCRGHRGGGCLPRGRLPRGVCVSQHALGRGVCPSACWDTPPDRILDTLVKTLPFCNYVADGNNYWNLHYLLEITFYWPERKSFERYYNLYLWIISDVNGYIPLNGVCNWYDSAGQINQQKIRAIMEKENCNVCITVSLRYNPAKRTRKSYL